MHVTKVETCVHVTYLVSSVFWRARDPVTCGLWHVLPSVVATTVDSSVVWHVCFVIWLRVEYYDVVMHVVTRVLCSMTVSWCYDVVVMYVVICVLWQQDCDLLSGACWCSWPACCVTFERRVLWPLCSITWVLWPCCEMMLWRCVMRCCEVMWRGDMSWCCKVMMRGVVSWCCEMALWCDVWCEVVMRGDVVTWY